MNRIRLRGVVVILVALAGPPAAVWIGTSVAQAFKAPPPPEARVEKFGDYFSPADPNHQQRLGGGTPFWEGTPGKGAPFFASMKLTQNALVMLSSSRLIAVDRRSRQVLGDYSIQENGTLESMGATTLASAEQPNHVWLYSWHSGDLGLYDFSANLALRESRSTAPSLKSVKWSNGQVFASGPFESELVRIYGALGDAMVLVATVGAPLFPGLVPALAKSLDQTSFDVTSTGTRMAVAYQWSDRIDIYDVGRRELERSIAGPVETKLDFAVAKLNGNTIFTLSDETRFSYVDVAVTDDLILGLFSGSEKREGGQSFGLGRQIHAFTWDGRPVGTWQLQDPLQQIEVDPATGTLYGLRWKPTTSVVAIDIAPLLDAARQKRAKALR